MKRPIYESDIFEVLRKGGRPAYYQLIGGRWFRLDPATLDPVKEVSFSELPKEVQEEVEQNGLISPDAETIEFVDSDEIEEPAGFEEEKSPVESYYRKVRSSHGFRGIFEDDIEPTFPSVPTDDESTEVEDEELPEFPEDVVATEPAEELLPDEEEWLPDEEELPAESYRWHRKWRVSRLRPSRGRYDRGCCQ